MISLSKSGGTVTFTFDDNSGYLQNGTIEVPVNSLSLILDESNMATFRKSASNDIFVSANIAEFGMSKSELEAWYKENLVGSTGMDSGTVQTMIVESISGKADSVSAVSSAEYVSSSTTINFKNVEGTVISSIDASDFVIDGMVDDVKIETISGVSYLVIDFNTASGKEDIQIPLTDIFDPSNYYTKAEVDNTISAATSGKADTSAVTAVNDTLTAHTANTNIHVTSEEKSTWNAKSDFSGSYNDLTDKPTIPTSASQLTNDAGYITSDALSGYAESSAVTAEINAATSGKADSSAVTQAISGAVGTFGDFWEGVDDEGYSTTYLGYGNQEGVGLGSIKIAREGSGLESDYNGLLTVVGKVNESTFNSYSASTNTAISGKQDALVSGTNIKTINNESILGSGNIDIQGGGGNPTVELTQAEYDALVTAGTVSANTYYIITDATPIDINNYWTSAQTSSAISDATSGKVDTSAITSSVTSASTDNEIPTAKAVYDAIPTGGTGGGKAISAGTNISVTTGETADTINCTLPIYMAGTTNLKYGSDYNTLKSDVNSSYNSIFGYNNTIDKDGTNFNWKCENNTIFGRYNKLFVSNSGKQLYSCSILGQYNTISSSTDSIYSSVALGDHNKGNNSYQALFGYYNNATNIAEHSVGQYNVSSSGSSTFGDSGNTLFSVGNGTADNARHNAFEIRQNGDIYANNGTSDVKLQDYLQIKVVKLTQVEYDALSPNYDPNTLYIIKD